MSGRAVREHPRPWPNQNTLEDTMQTSSTPRLKKFGDVLALKWDGTTECAEDVFDFMRDTECRITDEAVVEFLVEGSQWLTCEPGDWLFRRCSGTYDTASGPALLAELRGER